MATTGPMTITCPACGESIPVPAKVVVDLPHTSTVLVRMDSTQARAHFTECAKRAPGQQANLPAKREPAPDNPELRGRIHRMLDMRAYIHPGKRACTMCGTAHTQCLESLRNSVPCCGACGEGNTHPVPQQDLSCAEWAAQQEAQR